MKIHYEKMTSANKDILLRITDLCEYDEKQSDSHQHQQTRPWLSGKMCQTLKHKNSNKSNQ